MSRVGKRPIPLPQGVTVKVELGVVTVQGPMGTLSQPLNSGITVEVEDGQLLVNRESEAKEHKALHGLIRTLLANMVTGVTEEFRKKLDIVGVGYRAQEAGAGVVLQLGFSHPVEMQPIEGTALTVEGNNRVHVSGIDKQLVGEMAARIRRKRPPNVYTGKGVRYLDERVKLKPGKSAARSA
jgi:large subunit ribosomal protein L6